MSTNNELLIRLARGSAKAMSPSDADIVTKLCTQLDCALAAARTACGERTAAHSTLEKAREISGCPDGVDLQDHLKQLVAENLVMQQAIDQHRCGFIVCPACNLEISSATDDVCYAMSETPATDSILRASEARARIEGINFAASRLAAAYNQGFIDKPLPEVFDVVRMILSAKEDLSNTPAEDGLSGGYAEQALKDWEAELSEGKAE